MAKSKEMPLAPVDADPSEAERNPLYTPPAELPTVELPSAHHFGITRLAIEHRAADLKKLAEKTEGEGYAREARVIRGDADALTEDVLPQFQAQAELTLDPDELPDGIKNELRGLVYRHVLATEDATEPNHRQQLLEALGERVSAFVVQVAERAYNAGLQARKDAPGLYALKALKALRG